MGRAKKPALTRRMQWQQRAVLDLNGADYNYPWPHIAKTTAEANAMAAYFFAKRWRGREINFHALQRIVIKSECARAAYLFAKDVEGANIRRLQKVVLDSGTVEEKRQFAKIPGADEQWLEAVAAVQEVMEL